MAMNSGSCKFGLWFLHVYWSEEIVFRTRFSLSPLPGPVPHEVTRYFAGTSTDLSPLRSEALTRSGVAGRVYQEVVQIPYGSTATYGQIAVLAGTSPRAVGTAMRLNPTPVLIPCHRVVAVDGIGGFSPDISLKHELLTLEQGRGSVNKSFHKRDERRERYQ